MRTAPTVLLINPNSSTETTAMMVALAQKAAGEALRIVGATATRAPLMIAEPAELQAAAAEVVEIARSQTHAVAGVIIAAFGDPGLIECRSTCAIPVIGIAEASMLEVAANELNFGIVSTTPSLAKAIDARVAEVGLSKSCVGLRCTSSDPSTFVGSSEAALDAALTELVQQCIRHDGAEAVIIGGGPLSAASVRLQNSFAVPIVAPIESAVRLIISVITGSSDVRTR